MHARGQSVEGRSARITIYKPASVGLSQFGMRRPVPNSLKDRTPQTLDRFDDETMFFDVFRSDGDLLCLGPPLHGCIPDDKGVYVSDPRSGSRLNQRIEPPRIQQQHTSRLTASGLGAGSDTVVLHAGGSSMPIAVNMSDTTVLADRRVLLTLFKDYPLPWIRDWVTFHVRLHGADAVLLYENGSANYTPDDVAAALSDISGLQEVVVVSWPFRYGVGGRPGEPAWDNFCQTGALDHARRCFCRDARSILNIDIDELIPPGEMSIFERVETSPHAVLLFRGIWAEAPGIEDLEALLSVRHRDCSFVWQSQMNMFALGRSETLCRTKWAAVPSRCGQGVEWGVHDVYPADDHARASQRSWRTLDRSIAYRHCRQINTGWKSDRWRSSADFDDICSPDPDMASAFSVAFGEPET
jgi:hypothetical protein